MISSAIKCARDMQTWWKEKTETDRIKNFTFQHREVLENEEAEDCSDTWGLI